MAAAPDRARTPRNPNHRTRSCHPTRSQRRNRFTTLLASKKRHSLARSPPHPPRNTTTHRIPYPSDCLCAAPTPSPIPPPQTPLTKETLSPITTQYAHNNSSQFLPNLKHTNPTAQYLTAQNLTANPFAPTDPKPHQLIPTRRSQQPNSGRT